RTTVSGGWFPDHRWPRSSMPSQCVELLQARQWKSRFSSGDFLSTASRRCCGTKEWIMEETWKLSGEKGEGGPSVFRGATARHEDDARPEPGDDVHEIGLEREDLSDVLVGLWGFIHARIQE